ncbi:hypothetical protein DFS34DRAFT_592759 [Phlyctochytrium arcticum]|nr:hypothetical protein DFS34DRAFT_592759 [Phlyctochytrium arcticum]
MPDTSDSEADGFLPALPPHLAARRKEQKQQQQQQQQGSARQGGRRVPGPAMPPPAGYQPPPPVNDSDSEDDYAPKPLPSHVNLEEEDLKQRIAAVEERDREAREAEERRKRPEKLERGDWMLIPPEPSRLPADLGSMTSRQFRKSAAGSGDVDQSGWTETPQERAKRGVEKRKRPAADEPRELTAEERKTKQFVEEYNEKKRGKSLMDEHMGKVATSRSYEEEDISKRKFDREKDFATRRIDTKKRSEMVDQARKLDSKFGHGRKTFL